MPGILNYRDMRSASWVYVVYQQNPISATASYFGANLLYPTLENSNSGFQICGFCIMWKVQLELFSVVKSNPFLVIRLSGNHCKSLFPDDYLQT